MAHSPRFALPHGWVHLNSILTPSSTFTLMAAANTPRAPRTPLRMHWAIPSASATVRLCSTTAAAVRKLSRRERERNRRARQIRRPAAASRPQPADALATFTTSSKAHSAFGTSSTTVRRDACSGACNIPTSRRWDGRATTTPAMPPPDRAFGPRPWTTWCSLLSAITCRNPGQANGGRPSPGGGKRGNSLTGCPFLLETVPAPSFNQLRTDCNNPVTEMRDTSLYLPVAKSTCGEYERSELLEYSWLLS